MLGSFCQRQFSVGWQCENSKADGPPGYRGQSATGQKGGVGQTCLIMDVTLTTPTKPHPHPKGSLSFSLKHVGETTRSRLFGVVPGRSENIPGLFSSLCIMTSQYFDESLTLVLGFLYWKELGLDAPICFWTMDS